MSAAYAERRICPRGYAAGWSGSATARIGAPGDRVRDRVGDRIAPSRGDVGGVDPGCEIEFLDPQVRPVPTPVEPNRNPPGFVFAAAISSLTVVTAVVSPATST